MFKKLFVLIIITLLLSACIKHKTEADDFLITMQTHLKSISIKDIDLMKTTLAKDGEFYLTLPSGSMTTSVNEFIKGQTAWFQQKNWQFTTKIVKHEHGKQFGYALVIADYHEDDRNGKPYHHQMFISYDLKKVNARWLIVKDHASTIKKTQ